MEARALLGRMEYNRGNMEAALHIFDGTDITTMLTQMKLSIAQTAGCRKLRLHSNSVPPMSMHAVSLLFEAIFLKAKSLAHLGRFKEAAQSCNIILDTFESALPEGLPKSFGTDCKLHDTLSMAVGLLPELWKLAGCFQDAISSYRRALLTFWNLGIETITKLQKEFAIFLLYGGCDADPPDLRFQMDGFFVPRNNMEEAVLLLMILLRMFALKKVEWDPSVVDHLTFALSVSGELNALARQVESLLPRVIERKERYYTLALCYLGEKDDLVALNLLKKILSAREDPNCLKALLLASKICGENCVHAEEGASFAHRALANLDRGCDLMGSVANLLLGICLSAQARSSVSNSERVAKQYEALEVLEKARKITQNIDYRVIYNLSLENADHRKLDAALCNAKLLVRLEAGSNVKSWILLARILSAQRRFVDAENIINAALDQTGKWSQGALLRTKARVQVAKGHLKNAIETYTQLLAVLHLKSKSITSGMKFLKGGENDRNLELEAWHDLCNVYISMSQWRDAEVCLSKLKGIRSFSVSRWHATGQLYEAKGLHREAFSAYRNALEIEPTHIPSLVSTATVLRQLGGQSVGIVRSYLTEALQLDRTNPSAWFNLGLLYKSEGGRSVEASECFQAAVFLEESAPVENFR
uniref:Tetratricopeptide repeat protein 7B n=1 Tax=Anthurium amnicola TaxID=1678845 RepID=A0A1D1XL24_9ARAE